MQPLARRLDRRSPLRTARAGLPVIVAGTLVAAAAAALGAPALAVVAALVLGTGYGMCLVAGLLEAQRAAAPDELATLTALYWALTYLGFLLPVLLAALTGLASYPVLLVGVAAVQLASLAAVTVAGRNLAVASAA